MNKKFFMSAFQGEKILITMNMSTPSTAGFTIEFASGNFFFDFKEGAGKQSFTSNVELSNTYTTPGTYIGELSGPLELITKFIADNSKITFIENLKTGLLTDFRINNNLYSGVLNMTNAPVSGIFFAYVNAGLTNVSFASSGNSLLTLLRIYNCNLTGILDLSNVPVSNGVRLHNNLLLTNVTFASSGNLQVGTLLLSGCNLTGTLVLSNVPVGGGSFLQTFNNPLLINIIFASSGNGILNNSLFQLCDLNYINFAGSGFNMDANGLNFRIEDNSMIAGDVNHILVDLYSLVSGESGGGDYTGRIINISGTNAAPDGSSGGFDGDQAVIDLTGKGITVTTS